MAYTPLLGLLQPTTGSLNGTWGDAVNNQITQLIEDAIAGYSTASVASGDWDLTDTDGATDTARSAILIPTGSPGVTRYINAPKQSKAYVVINQSDSTVVLRGGPSTPTTGTPISAGASGFFAWNGSDFVSASSQASSLATTNFSIVESGGKLVFKYGSTTIASLDSSGNLITAGNMTAGTTP